MSTLNRSRLLRVGNLVRSPSIITAVVAVGLAGSFQGEPATVSRPVAQDELAATLAAEGIALDREAGLVSIGAEILVRDELLEYLLVGPRGQTHESLLVTTVRPSLLNAALLTLGVEPGTNARWSPPTDDGREQPVVAPTGDGFELWLAWREDDEVYRYRVDDLVTNLSTGRNMPRHRWVFLGSRFASLGEGDEEVFLADVEGNLVNIAYFYEGNTLLTAALEACADQTIWVANAWLLPPRGSAVRLIFARDAFVSWPQGWSEGLPRHTRAKPDDRPGAAGAK